MLSSRLNSASLFMVVMMLPPLLSLCAALGRGELSLLKRRCVETQNGYASGAFLYQEFTR